MNLFNRSILPFFIVAFFLGAFLAGCLDAPDYPESFTPIDSIRIQVKQKNGSYSSQLKVHPSDSATIKAAVVPEKYQNDLKFEWFCSNAQKDSLLGRGAEFSFFATKGSTKIPNKLTITDSEGNKESQAFTVIINSAPVLSDSTTPSSGDTLFGTPNSAFLFTWYSMDMDLYSGDTLFHTLDIDGKEFDVGILLQVKQSGLKPGEHKFRIIVHDLYGDSDTLAYKNFFVIDTLEAK